MFPPALRLLRLMRKIRSALAYPAVLVLVTVAVVAGVVTALIDHACAATISSIKRGGAPTLDLRVDYMRAAAPRAGVTCEAHCYKLTRTIAFVRATAWDVDRDDPVATALATFAVPEPRA